MKPTFFKSQTAFRAWLAQFHQTEKELIVGFYKVKSGKQKMTWSQSVDQALCYGWIDGIRRTIDEESYQIRFTPRRKNSVWSKVNLKKVEELTQKGLMQPAGLKSYEYRNSNKANVYAFEQEKLQFSQEYLTVFQEHKKAWDYFQNLAPSYKKNSIYWVMTAKRAETQQKRLKKLIEDSEKGTNQWKHNKYKKK
ncbi:MAG: YdeI/OmpD-associated family protein [Flavobacteriales bacterium]|jgi:uncharacterized protein YdeI (YjbR/CyaY-like superfamily)|nr:YdeI/OmpD-associated family protein [Flavobacteriales bacterium]